VGVIGLALLPIDQYPKIVPPVVKVSASYPGASAQTVTQAVATPIEQELNGTPGMLYMESSSTNSGGFTATITFDIDTDADLAAVEVQNRVKLAESRLPAEVVQNGISVEKQASSKLLTITLLSSDPKFDEIYLSNYATLNVLDMLRRVPGVGSVSNVGSPLLRHADLGAARPAGQSGADGAGLAAGIEGSEPRIGRRRARAAAHDRSRRDDPHYGAGGVCRRWASSRRSSSAPTPTARSSACATWRAFRSKRRPITPKAVSTGEVPRCSTSTCCRAPTPWRWPTR